MPKADETQELSRYFTACETFAESRFNDLSAERRKHVAMWSAAVMESLKDEKVSMSDIHLMLGTLAGMVVHQEAIPAGLDKADIRNHGRNLLVGAFERGCDGISLLDLGP
mgnify:CR=1 FL=1|tara:strand:- start:1224 stop:1553 length:330 start_codon:yes stop_codon:yes gene_type:complete